MFTRESQVGETYSERDIATKCVMKVLDFKCYKKDKIMEEYSIKAIGKNKRIDILLLDEEYKFIAIIEVKKFDKDVERGLRQAMEYAAIIGVEFVYSTAGEYFVEYNRLTHEKRSFAMDNFPYLEDLLKMRSEELC